MVDTSVNPNSVYIPAKRFRPKKKSLQLKYFLRFNSDFPSQLRGIINEEEFQQSINEINEAFLRKQLTPKDYWYIYFLAGVVGLVLALVSIRLSSKAMLVIGLTLIIVSTICFFGGCFIRYSKRKARLAQVLAEQTRKYSSRLSTACKWRIDIKYIEQPLEETSEKICNLVIDMVPPTVATKDENKVYCLNPIVLEPTALVEQSNNHLPPPYPYHSV